MQLSVVLTTYAKFKTNGREGIFYINDIILYSSFYEMYILKTHQQM